MLSPEEIATRIQSYVDGRVTTGTSKHYRKIVRRYVECCRHYNITPFPLSEDSLCTFVTINTGTCNANTLANYLSAIGDYAKLNGFEYNLIRESFKVKALMRGIRMQHPWKISRKSPLTLKHLEKIFPLCNLSNREELVFWAMCMSSAFFGLLRLGEITDNADTRKILRIRHLTINQSSAEIFLPASKTDQFFNGDRVTYLPRQGVLCPLTTLSALKTATSALDDPLFPDASGAPMTRGRFMAMFRRFFGNDTSLSGHSFRCGGATWLASQGYSSLDIQRIGRWSSEAFKIYLRSHPFFDRVLNPLPTTHELP